MSDKFTTYLTPDQVTQLNEKHGYFQFADAQGNVSQDFAQDAIAMHEQIRSAAQDLLKALKELVDEADGFNVSGVYFDEQPAARRVIAQAYAAIQKATGVQP